MRNPVFLIVLRDSFPVLLVANKVDLLHSRKISEDKGRDLANQLGVEYIETSAKEPPLNIDSAFHEVLFYFKISIAIVS